MFHRPGVPLALLIAPLLRAQCPARPGAFLRHARGEDGSLVLCQEEASGHTTAPGGDMCSPALAKCTAALQPHRNRASPPADGEHRARAGLGAGLSVAPGQARQSWLPPAQQLEVWARQGTGTDLQAATKEIWP